MHDPGAAGIILDSFSIDEVRQATYDLIGRGNEKVEPGKKMTYTPRTKQDVYKRQVPNSSYMRFFSDSQLAGSINSRMSSLSTRSSSASSSSGVLTRCV